MKRLELQQEVMLRVRVSGRYFHNAKLTQIYEGTSEVQRMAIAKALLT